ncbi:hypothetical protein F4680DRAFT_438916 [Xylaria scruposa]|nr:hypothetical protein F4680DRAFT_438916 [Xylaria scruposa]
MKFSLAYLLVLHSAEYLFFCTLPYWRVLENQIPLIGGPLIAPNQIRSHIIVRSAALIAYKQYLGCPACLDSGIMYYCQCNHFAAFLSSMLGSYHHRLRIGVVVNSESLCASQVHTQGSKLLRHRIKTLLITRRMHVRICWSNVSPQLD